MGIAKSHSVESMAARAFTRQSASFDQLFTTNPIVQYKRQRVRDHVQQWISPRSSILELNAGTGEDAVWFASRGHDVHATDLSTGMREQFLDKAALHETTGRISHELCSFTELGTLANKGPFDMIFSNFAGLNCTGRLDKVLADLPELLKPGGLVTMVIMPGFCIWEFLLAFRGKFKTAFRRLAGRNGTKAHIEGEYFTCWYYNPSYVIRHMPAQFELVSLEGLCTLVPPSYFENFPSKRPLLFEWLKKKEFNLKSRRPWRSVGDYFIITFKKKTDN